MKDFNKNRQIKAMIIAGLLGSTLLSNISAYATDGERNSEEESIIYTDEFYNSILNAKSLEVLWEKYTTYSNELEETFGKQVHNDLVFSTVSVAHIEQLKENFEDAILYYDLVLSSPQLSEIERELIDNYREKAVDSIIISELNDQFMTSEIYKETNRIFASDASDDAPLAEVIYLLTDYLINMWSNDLEAIETEVQIEDELETVDNQDVLAEEDVNAVENEEISTNNKDKESEAENNLSDTDTQESKEAQDDHQLQDVSNDDEEVSNVFQNDSGTTTQESIEELLDRAMNGSGASARWNASVRGVETYPNDGRFVEALQLSGQNMLRLGVQAHRQGNYSDALHYYNRLLAQSLLEDNLLVNAKRYKQQAEASSQLETQDDLLQRARSGSGASNRWNAALEGLEYYPEDSRFVSALQAASHNILRLGMQSHAQGNYTDALFYYSRLTSQDTLENSLLKRVSRYKGQAESSSQLETQDDLLQRARSGSGASNRWNAALEGLEYYPEDSRFVSALQAASHNILRLGMKSHAQGNYTDALFYYSRLASQDTLENSLLKRVSRYKDQAEASSQLETQDDLLQRARSGSGASNRWNAAVEGLEYYPEDSRFVSALQAASHNILRLGMQSHELGNYSDALFYYNRLSSQDKLESSLLNRVSRFKQQAETSTPLETVDDLYNRATTASGASARWHASLEGLEFYPGDNRFVGAFYDSSQRILRLGMDSHNRRQYNDAQVYYQRLINESRVPNDISNLAIQLQQLAVNGNSIMTVNNYINAINSSSSASEIWHLVNEAIVLYPDNSRIQEALDQSANRQLVLGRNYYRSGDFSASMSYFNRVLSQPMVSQGLQTLANSYNRLSQANYKPTVYIDAGHGGRDPGATFGGVQEKVLNLNTSLYLQEELEKRGYNVLMARTTDVYMDLTARPLEANAINADLFISIHYNSMGGTGTARGIETFIYHRVASGYGQELNRGNFNTYQSRIDESLRLADAVHSNLIKETGLRNRGVKGQNFNVLRNTEIPAMLTELGFLDNAAERAHVNTASFQRAAARAMANGVDQYFGK